MHACAHVPEPSEVYSIRACAAKEEFEQELATDSMDSNILDYCSLDQKVTPTMLPPCACAVRDMFYERPSATAYRDMQ